MPYGNAIQFVLQTRVTKTLPRRPATIERLAKNAVREVADFRRHSEVELGDAVFLEIGAGRDLTVPLTLRALGVGQVVSVDLNPLARLPLINAAANTIGQLHHFDFPKFETWSELSDFGIHYKAPCDLRHPVEGLSIDAFVSNDVMEHIPRADMIAILKATQHAMRPNAVGIHTINYADHFARDCGVSPHNYLQYSGKYWDVFNPPSLYVNRLRHPDYLQVFELAALNAAEVRIDVKEAIPPAIRENIVAPFDQHSIEDLEILTATWMVQPEPASSD